MAQVPSSENKEDKKTPEPEMLHAQDASGSSHDSSKSEHLRAAFHERQVARRGSYRPSHKATFIGLGVVIIILSINVVVIMFFMRNQQGANSSILGDEVTLSSETLGGLGVSRNAAGNQGSELTVAPNSSFNGNVTVAKDVNIAGQLKLNSKFSANEASLAKLEAGNTAVSQLNVNGDATANNLNIRRDFTVVGTTRLQGPVTATQLVTINNNLNVSGNLAVGGTLSARSFQASSLTSDTTLTIGGHIITRGSAPGVSPGGALGSNGTVSISGNDAAGTVAANIGVGAANGIIANVTFRGAYGTTPRVVVSAIGRNNGNIYINRTASGFSIGVNDALPPGGYAFDYIVMQ